MARSEEINGTGLHERRFLGTGMPGWLMLGLVALGLPRTILEDLGIVAPESSWVYFVLALTPFAVWLAVALFRRTATPIQDHLVTGALYGLSLFIVHGALWATGAPDGPEQGAVSMFGIAMMIGLGVGAVAAVVAAAAKGVRAVRGR